MNREDFPMLKQDIVYFDNGATTLKPQCVIDKMVDYYSNYTSNIHRGDYNAAIRTNHEYDSTREVVRDFVGALDQKEIIFTKGSTEALNMIAFGFLKKNLKPGDEILSGCINLDGLLEVKVQKKYEDSSVSKIMKLRLIMF